MKLIQMDFRATLAKTTLLNSWKPAPALAIPSSSPNQNHTRLSQPMTAAQCLFQVRRLTAEYSGNPATATPANLSDAAVQGSLVVCIEHMASLCSFASHIFSEIVKEASTTHQRVETLRGRVQDALQLLPTVEDTLVKSSTEVLLSNPRRTFASATNEGAQLFTKDNRTNSINQTYGRAEKPPSFSRVNPYMENNVDALNLYSNPRFFVEQWNEGRMLIREANKKSRAQRRAAARAKKAQSEGTKLGVVQVRYDQDAGQKIIEEVPQVAAHITVQSQLTYAEGSKPIDLSHANVIEKTEKARDQYEDLLQRIELELKEAKDRERESQGVIQQKDAKVSTLEEQQRAVEDKLRESSRRILELNSTVAEKEDAMKDITRKLESSRSDCEEAKKELRDKEKKLEEELEKMTCQICMEEERRFVLSCGHIFCKSCVQCSAVKNTCPVCRVVTDAEPLQVYLD
ncbi:hypothetical protein PROFUN_15199 [Planoprotostelium fungivorum]|uniref:RING-type domain-containing protein n=1 Tax=Planoprotostelium fungivorum TaxID=1890364 RepID=A0A2P6MXT6_9EUKA|nr:hypothetical protein PROFUN_15199 [Planoprotostelium fungivorum]